MTVWVPNRRSTATIELRPVLGREQAAVLARTWMPLSRANWRQPPWMSHRSCAPCTVC